MRDKEEATARKSLRWGLTKENRLGKEKQRRKKLVEAVGV